MSRIGKNPVTIPSGVSIDVKDNMVTVKGKLGELTQQIDDIDIKVDGDQVILDRPSEAKDHKAKHGLYRALINNMVNGVSEWLD